MPPALLFCDQQGKANLETPVLPKLSHRPNAGHLIPLGFLLCEKNKPLFVKVTVNPVPCSLQGTLPKAINNIKEAQKNSLR